MARAENCGLGRLQATAGPDLGFLRPDTLPCLRDRGDIWAAGFPPLTTARSSTDIVGINRAALPFRGDIPNIGLTSEHPSGANVSLVDGSTRFLNYGSLSDAVWINLMLVKDGAAVSVP